MDLAKGLDSPAGKADLDNGLSSPLGVGMRFVSLPTERGFWMDFSGPLFQWIWSKRKISSTIEATRAPWTKSAPGSSGSGMMGLKQRAAGLCGRGREASRPNAALRPASGGRRENTRSARSASGTTEPLSGPQASTSVVGSSVMAEERTGLLSSVLRAYKVYRLALLVWLDYRKCRKSAEKRKRELGLDPLDPSADDHPEVDGIWRACHGRNASLLLEQIVSLRGLWIKAGQFISSRPDIVPFEYVSALSELQDSVPARPWSEVESTLANELGSEWRARFARVDESPLSTASIAQVHVAALKDGRKVALKVMHRGIRRRMRQDLQNLRVLTRALAYFEPDQDYRKIVEEWAPAVKMELDLRREAENLRFCEARMREAGVRVKIPLPVEQDGGSTRGVLCMEFCEGFSPKDTRRMDEAGVDKDLFMRRLVSCFARQIHVDGFYHADPHPGNILVSTAEEDGDASVPVLLDFGLVKTFPSEEMKRAFSKCVYSSYSLNLDELANSFVEMGLLINDGAKDPFRDMNAMRMLFSPTPKSRLKERRAAIRERRKREKEEEEEEEEERAGRRTAAAAKPKKPVDAWPSELVFFLRYARTEGRGRGKCCAVPKTDVASHPISISSSQLTTPSRRVRGACVLALDTTYCSHKYASFPSQRRVVEAVAKCVVTEVASNPKVLVLVGSYTIGKEAVFFGVARALGRRVYIGANKRRVMGCLDLTDEEKSLVCEDDTKTNVHAVPLGYTRSHKKLESILKHYKGKYTGVVAVCPTGWSLDQQAQAQPKLTAFCGARGKPSAMEPFVTCKRKGRVVTYSVPYSEHSSYDELRSFVSWLQPKELLPFVRVSDQDALRGLKQVARAAGGAPRGE